MTSDALAGFSRIDRTERTLEVENLTVRYGDVLAVDSVSFSARAGEVTAVLGPNGAGKTSTIEVCEGLRRRTSGEVRVLGLDPHEDRRSLAKRVGIMLQEGGIYPSARPADVIRQYCGLYSSGSGGAADPEELIELVGLSERRRTAWRRLSGRKAAGLIGTGAGRPTGDRLPRRTDQRGRRQRSHHDPIDHP